MKIAVLSGKGGTGKTTVSASLAYVTKPSQYVDCDVEEPNGSIFLKPKLEKKVPVMVEIPSVKQEVCTGCGQCAAVCQFNAIAVVKGKVLIFPEICHHCGACFIVCKEGALIPAERTIGDIETNGENTFLQGKLNIGEPISIPIIKKMKEYMREDVPTIIDCSPGASCTVVSSIEDCDFCVLVTEPTPFGLHDLKIAASLVQKLGIPCGIVINKASGENKMIRDYCKEENLEILLEIPFSKEIAASYSKGTLPVAESQKWQEKFNALFERVKEGARR